MASDLTDRSVASEGNPQDGSFRGPQRVETVRKRDAIRCLNAAIESFIAARDWSRDQLAEDICGMTPANFSKVTNGVQGDWLGLLHEKLPGEIRQDYYERMAELERADPLALAMEQLQAAMLRVMRLQAGTPLPTRTNGQIKADTTERRKRTA